jgi:hypothetical protein
VNALAALEFGENPVPGFIQSDGNNLFAQPEDRTQLPQLEAKALNNFAVHEVQQYRALVEQSNFYSQRCKHRRVFQPDNSGSHDNQVARHFFQSVNLI